MKYRINYSPLALSDLDEIFEYINSELLNPSAAFHTVMGIHEKIEGLEDFPEIGAMLSSVIDVQSDYRFLLSGKYMIFYRFLNGQIYIDRVLYGGRDYVQILLQK